MALDGGGCSEFRRNCETMALEEEAGEKIFAAGSGVGGLAEENHDRHLRYSHTSPEPINKFTRLRTCNIFLQKVARAPAPTKATFVPERLQKLGLYGFFRGNCGKANIFPELAAS